MSAKTKPRFKKGVKLHLAVLEDVCRGTGDAPGQLSSALVDELRASHAADSERKVQERRAQQDKQEAVWFEPVRDEQARQERLANERAAEEKKRAEQEKVQAAEVARAEAEEKLRAVQNLQWLREMYLWGHDLPGEDAGAKEHKQHDDKEHKQQVYNGFYDDLVFPQQPSLIYQSEFQNHWTFCFDI